MSYNDLKEKNMKNYTKQLVDLLNIKSPTGNTEEAIQFSENIFNNLGLETKRTKKGALIATIPGENKAITFSAHVDTLAAMVKDITPNGRLKLTQIGGYAWTTIEGAYVEVDTIENKTYTGTVLTNVASSHVHGTKTNATVRDENTIEVRLDEKVSSREDVEKLGINIGDFVNFDPRVQVSESGFIKSRHLDDKACVVALYAIAEHFTKNPSKNTIHFFISNYEEVGHGASAAIPLDTHEFIALDMAAPGAGQSSDEFSVTICVKDSSGPYDLKMKNELHKIAKEKNIPFKLDIYPYYGSDGSAAWRAGYDFPIALIGPGVDASHSFERTHHEAIDATIDLAIAYVEAYNKNN